jgi:HAD superfamily hydrolase (TIGR01484 family)
LEHDEACGLHGLLFDLDDTLLDHGALLEAPYSALFRLREAGLTLMAVTGRPVGWGNVLARQWPVAAVVAETGAIAVYRQGRGVKRLDSVDAAQREPRRAQLRQAAEQMHRQFPQLRPGDDNDARVSDYTFDIGEQQRVERELVQAAVDWAHAHGLNTSVSSVNLHITLEHDDKASGSLRALRVLSGVDPTVARLRYAYIGDSENDAPCFATFRTSIATHNLVGSPTVRPRFITTQERGAGFAEAARIIIERRNQS